MSESDLDEWELLPDDGSLDVHDDCEVKLYSPKRFHSSNSVLDTSYFAVSDDCPPRSEEEKIFRGENPELTDDRDGVAQVSFEKSEENEFVDMKLGDGVDKPPCSPRKMKCEAVATKGKADHGEEDAEALNLWKWSVNGIGAICSFSVAAATFCFLVIGSQNGKKYQKQGISFRIYPDDQRLVRVLPRPNKLDEAISAARGLPQIRAQVVFGGYYHGF